MTLGKLQFVEDLAATLIFYPTEKAVASAATVTLYKPGGTELKASSAATISSVSTTTSADIDATDRSFTVTSATGLVSGRRILVSGGGEVWEPTIRSVSGTTVYTFSQAPVDFSSGATVVGYDLSLALTSTETADKNDNYLARWEYTIDSVDYQGEQPFDVVAATYSYPTTIEHVDEMHAEIIRELTAEDGDGEHLLRGAWRQRVLPLIYGRALRPERIRDRQRLIPLHVACVAEIYARRALSDSANAEARDEYDAARESVERQAELLFGALDWYDRDDDLQAEGGEENIAVGVWMER